MTEPLVTVTSLRHLPGFAWGFRGPVIRLDLIISAKSDRPLAPLARLSATLVTALKALQRPAPHLEDSPGATHPAAFILDWVHRALLLAAVPLFEQGRTLAHEAGHHCLVIPVFLMPTSTLSLLVERLVTLLNLHHSAPPADKAIDTFLQFVKQISDATGTGSNVPRFLKAACELGIQTTYVTGNTIQYGQGSQARWLDSSFTDRTPVIGSGMARNKVMTNSVLRQAGIPVAPQTLVTSVDHAVAEARRLGFPVVIKPADRDGGEAVHAGLMSATEIQAACADVSKTSTNIIIEKHILGRDYRLNIFANQVLWAIERMPAGVTGDGVSTLTQLVERENQNPMRHQGTHSPLKKLVFDSEALAVLKSTGLRPDSIPPQGRFVALRRKANIGTGGWPVSVMDSIHPDNARLALRAAALLGLDLAGVDLLLPDISRSWLDTGGVVCEVNGQPQLGAVTSAHTYREILQTLFPTGGRIPIALVLGSRTCREAIPQAARLLGETGLKVGWSGERGVFIGEEAIHPVDTATYTSGKMLLISREVDAALLRADAASIAATGLPCDRYDLLVIGEDDDETADDSHLDTVLAMILPACTGRILTLAGRQSRVLPALAAARRKSEPITLEQLPAAIAHELLSTRANP